MITKGNILGTLKISVTIILVCSLSSCGSKMEKGTDPKEQRPNIVIILADDLGTGDVGYHGSDIKTPNIDRLSREGVILNRFYVAPVCSPTRAGIMTGRYPNRFGLRETVILLFLSDNGPAPNEGGITAGLRGHKFHEWEGGVRVPAVVKWPNAFEGGRKVNQVMGYIDVLPTLKEIAGIKTKSKKALDGISMLPVLKGKQDSIDRDFYLGYGAIVTNKWKLIKKDSRNNSMKVKEDMLFDMETDSGETTNITNKHPQIYEELKEAVDRYDAIKPKLQVPSYQEGRNGFKAPKEWNIEAYPVRQL